MTLQFTIHISTSKASKPTHFHNKFTSTWSYYPVLFHIILMMSFSEITKTISYLCEDLVWAWTETCIIAYILAHKFSHNYLIHKMFIFKNILYIKFLFLVTPLQLFHGCFCSQWQYLHIYADLNPVFPKIIHFCFGTHHLSYCQN